jgi:hypothetical protein
VTNNNLAILNSEVNAIELNDALYDRLNKAKALAEFALTDSICDQLNDSVRHYLSALSQLIHEAWEINKQVRR